MTTQNTNTKYFNIHTSGVGYLNRIREVTPKKGSSFWACSIAALRGAEDAIEYTYIDTRVSGAEAIKLIKRCVAAQDAQKKILIGFNIGDIYLDTFTYEKGDKIGQTGAGLKGRLLHISFIKVDGEFVYQAPKKEDSVTDAPSEVNSAEEQAPVSTSVNDVPAAPSAEEPVQQPVEEEPSF